MKKQNHPIADPLSCWKDLRKRGIQGHESIIKLHFELRKNIKEKWDRCLPFNEELFDRWERARFLKMGKGTSIYDSSIVIGKVHVGKNTWIGPFTILDGSGKLTIGSFCSISAGVHIYTHDSVKWALSGGIKKYEYSEVLIGDCCYIGPNSVISKGLTIGHHCVVGVSSFVNKDIPPYSICGGVPAEVIGKVKISKNKIIFDYNYSQ